MAKRNRELDPVATSAVVEVHVTNPEAADNLAELPDAPRPEGELLPDRTAAPFAAAIDVVELKDRLAAAEARLDAIAPAAVDILQVVAALTNAQDRIDTLTRALKCLLDPQSHLSARTQSLQDARSILAG